MKIHILGICGTFMSGIAILAKKTGHTVTGSDRTAYDPIKSVLDRHNIKVTIGHKIKDIKKMVLFCALGWRSALATKSLVEMGFKNVAHVDGGFDALKKSGLKIIKKEKK